MATAAGGLLEREHEIARLTRALEDAIGGGGRTILVEGPPGIGKTALLDVAAELAAEHGVLVLHARGGELESAVPFGLVRDLLARRVARLPPEDRSRLLAGAAELVLPALGLARSEGRPPEAAAVQFGLTWLVSELAERKPLALVIDDVQWSDSESAGWLVHLARRAGDLSLAVLLAARPSAADVEPPSLAALRELGDVERLRPQPLDRPSVAALVRTFYAADADDEFITACHAAVGGNPLYTHALLDAAAASDIPATAAGGKLLAPLAPEAIRLSVTGGLRRAGEAAAALARACAVLPEPVELRHAAALGGLDIDLAATAADRLAAEDLLASGRPLRFTHPVLRAAVRESIRPGEQARLHRLAADLFLHENDVLVASAHLLEVEPAGDPAVVAALRAGAAQALAEGAAGQAVRLLERLLAEPAPDDERPALLALLGRARMAAGTWEATDPLLAAADGTDDPDECAELLADAAWAVLWERPERMHEVASRLSSLRPGSGEGRLRAEAVFETASRWAGLPSTPAQELLARAEGLAGNTPAERELLAAAVLAGGTARGVPGERLLRLARRALSAPDQTPPSVVWTAADTAACLGASQEVLAPLDAAMAGCRRRGDQSGVEGLLQARIVAQLLPGRLRAAEVDARVLWRMASDKPAGSPSRAIALTRLLMTLALRGLVEEAAALVEEHGPFRHDGPAFVDDLLQFSAGWVAFERGDLRAAAESALAFEDALERRGMGEWKFAFWHRPTAVEALVRLGEPDAARPLADKELRLAEALGAGGTLGNALRSMGLVVGGVEGRALIERAVPLLEGAGELDRLARALIDLGRAIRLEGRPTDARDPLRRALDLAGECGAELVAQRALDELRATGAKPRRRALSGPESLTPSEARIARMAADGHTNREIAQTLYVSSKTVQTHLGHVYGKLGISGRSELAAALSAGT